MLKTITAEIFFRNNRPSGVPSDTDTPDFDSLVEKTNTLVPSNYPLEILRDILLRENLRIGAEKTAVDSIKAIDDDTVFIFSGQQAGLFGGPLYTHYKAMHTIKLSSILSKHTGKRVIPIFWVASDDHDFEEIRKIGVLTKDGSEYSIEYSPIDYIGGSPAGNIMLDEGISDAVDSLSEHCSPGIGTEQYIEMIRAVWKPGVSWSDAFTAQMSKTFSPYGLVVFDPRWDGVKRLFKDIISSELTNPLASTKLVNEEADKNETSGQRKKALRKPDSSTNIFLENEGIRNPLFFENNIFRAGDLTFSKEEILNLNDSAPEKFSPGAVLRPICQDTVFPVAATVSGPGERIYLKQINPVYRLFHVNRSIPWPRATFTVVDRRTQRISEKENVTLEKMFSDLDHIRLELARKTLPEAIKDTLDNIEKTINNEFDSLADNIGAMDSTLIKSVLKEKGKILHSIEILRNRALRSHKSSLDITENRFASASYFLMPLNGPQERWFGFDALIPILDEHGLEEFINLTSPGEEKHLIVFPETG